MSIVTVHSLPALFSHCTCCPYWHDCNSSSPSKFNYLTTFCSSLLEHHFLAFLDSREARFLHSVLNIIPRFNFFSKLSKQVSVLWPTICLHQSNSPIAIISLSFGCLKILAKIQISFESRFSWFHNVTHKIRQRCRVSALTFVPINFYRTVCFVHGMLVHSTFFLV